MHLSLFQKIVSNFILQSLKTSKLRSFHTKKCLNCTKTKFAGQKLFSVLVQQRFSNSNLRQISDYKSISILIKSNIAFIRPFFSAGSQNKQNLIFYDWYADILLDLNKVVKIVKIYKRKETLCITLLFVLGKSNENHPNFCLI